MIRILTHKGTVGLGAPHCYPADDFLCQLHIQAPGSEVIEEEQRLRSMGQNVIHTHGHQIQANGGMVPHLLSYLQQTLVELKKYSYHVIQPENLITWVGKLFYT